MASLQKAKPQKGEKTKHQKRIVKLEKNKIQNFCLKKKKNTRANK